jgi:hypothetical protein
MAVRLLTEAEGETLRRAVAHAVGLYRFVLEGLGADPFTGLPGMILRGSRGFGGAVQ